MQPNKYEVIALVGEGAYGIVYQCRNKETGEYVAIKKFKETEDDIVKKTMKRELRVLQILKHENIVEFKHAFKKNSNLFLVFEYVERTLLELLQKQPKGLDPQTIRIIIFQLCKAVKYLHDMNIIHRDIKPENLLIDNNMRVKLCDFGFARSIKAKDKENLTDYVATRWYRSPELLLSNGVYGCEVDYWAIGCIMGELADGNPLFPGENETDQLHCIQKVLGSLTDEQVDMFYKNPLFHKKNLLDVQKPETLERRYMGKLNKTAISFMKALLNVDPKLRLKGNAVFEHQYFEGLPDNPIHSKTNEESSGTSLTARRIKVNPIPINTQNQANHPNSQQLNPHPSQGQEPITINTTNINIINYNNYDQNHMNEDDKAANVENVKKVKKVSQSKITGEFTNNIKPVSENNLNSTIAQNMNSSTGKGFHYGKNSPESHLMTSVNFNKNLKEKLNLISLLPNPSLDAAFKTFYKNKEDKYNFDIDIHNLNTGNTIGQGMTSNFPPNYQKSITNVYGGNIKNQNIINEDAEIHREEKKKTKISNVNLKTKRTTELLHHESSPTNAKHKLYSNNIHPYNKSTSPLKNLHYAPQGIKSNNINYGGNKNIHLPSISKNVSYNLKKFSQMMINK